MKILTKKKCIIGEGPVWNDKENLLYYTNGFGKEYCKYSFDTDELTVIPTEKDCAAFAFDKNNRLIVSREDGVFVLNDDGTTTDIYDTDKYEIKNANDMKAGVDGSIYVGTQSEKRLGISEKVNGKLYRIDKFGNVKILLDGLSLSNGMDWSADGKMFYHTDSDTNIIKEYRFDGINGEIEPTGREITIPGADGFTVDLYDKLYAASWGGGNISVVDLKTMTVSEKITVPCTAPSSCCFAGKNTDILVVTTASLGINIDEDKNGGFTLIKKMNTKGRKPYLYG